MASELWFFETANHLSARWFDNNVVRNHFIASTWRLEWWLDDDLLAKVGSQFTLITWRLKWWLDDDLFVKVGNHLTEITWRLEWWLDDDLFPEIGIHFTEITWREKISSLKLKSNFTSCSFCNSSVLLYLKPPCLVECGNLGATTDLINHQRHSPLYQVA